MHVAGYEWTLDACFGKPSMDNVVQVSAPSGMSDHLQTQSFKESNTSQRLIPIQCACYTVDHTRQ